MLHPAVEQAFQEIDAGMFSGDQFHNQEDLDRLKYFIERWDRNVQSCQDSVDYMKSLEGMGMEE